MKPLLSQTHSNISMRLEKCPIVLSLHGLHTSSSIDFVCQAGYKWWFLKTGLARDTRFNFACIIPLHLGEPTKIVVSSTLQMGWMESPPFFFCSTETIHDLTEFNMEQLADHPIMQFMPIQQFPSCARVQQPLRLLQVYVNDLCHEAMQSILEKNDQRRGSMDNIQRNPGLCLWWLQIHN